MHVAFPFTSQPTNKQKQKTQSKNNDPNHESYKLASFSAPFLKKYAVKETEKLK